MKFANLELYQPGDGLAMIRLAAPADRKNLLDSLSLWELHTALDHLQDSMGVKLVVITGKGRTFSTGANLDEIRDYGSEEVRCFLHAGQSLIMQIMEFGILTVAAVNGLAFGGGLELALACDIRWAHRRAVFAFPETKLGLLPGWGGVPLLRRLVPESFSNEMVTGGNLVTARKGYEMGLVSRLFEGEDFESAVLGELKLIAAMGENALRDIKAELRRGQKDVKLAECDDAFVTLWNQRNRGGFARGVE